MTLPDVRPGSTWRSLAVLSAAAAGTGAALTLVGGLRVAATGVAVVVAVAVLTARYVTGFDSQDSERRVPLRMLEERQVGLGDWDRVVEQALAGEGDRALLLRARLQRLYEARLSERHAISLYDRPEAAAALVGPEVWALIDPALAASPGPVPQRALRAAVDRLNAL